MILTSSASALLLLAGLQVAQAQGTPGVCDYGGYVLCVENIASFYASTCVPLQQAAPTFFAQCVCYRDAHLIQNCYSLCTTNSTLNSELANWAQPTANADCAAVKLDQANLPNPPPWQTFFDQIKSNSSSNGTGNGNNSNGTAGKSGNSAVSTSTPLLTPLIGLAIASFLFSLL